MTPVPLFIVIGGLVLTGLWVVSVALALAAFRANARRAVALAAISLVICGVGLVFKIQYGRQETTTVTVAGRAPETRTVGWHLNTRWFFMVSGLLGATALVVALKRDRRWAAVARIDGVTYRDASRHLSGAMGTQPIPPSTPL